MRIVYILILIVLIFSSCKNQVVDFEVDEFEFSCDAEILTEDKSKFISKECDTLFFTGGNARSDVYSNSGKYSILLNNAQPYGFSIEINNAKVDDLYEISVWRYKNGTKAKIVVEGEGFWIGGEDIAETNDENWEKIIMEFYIPPNYSGDKIKIYLWNPDANDAYFDDLNIKKVKQKDFPVYEESGLYIYVDETAMEDLKQQRIDAFESKILQTDDDSYVDAIVFYQGESMKAEIRLKGDWLDHLEGKKWSFRIKLKKGNSWKGMITFSIQTPEARSFLDEWLLHKIFESEDVLTTRYDFVPVYLNNENMGLYVYEEHFEKQLIESSNRREGPIVKFGEDQLWTSRVYKQEGNFNNFEAAEIIPFKENKTVKDGSLFAQFKIAQNLMYQYKYCLSTTSDIFDVDKLAKYFALIEVTQAFHGIIWHNQRFYYNPVLCRLEPIAFDSYVDYGVFQLADRAIYGNFDCKNWTANYNGFYNWVYLLSDKTFLEKYICYLEKYSSENYIDSMIEVNNSEIIKLEKNIQKEFEDYKYNYKFLLDNAKEIRSSLNELKNRDYSDFKTKELLIKTDYKCEYVKELAEKYVKAYTEADGTVKIINYYAIDINFIGFSIDTILIFDLLKDSITIKSYNNHDNYVNIKPVENGVKYFSFKVDGYEDIFTLNIKPWPYPSSYNPQLELVNNSIKINSIFKIEGNTIYIEAGNYVINKSIVIPIGYEVFVQANVDIDLIDSAAFISYSPMFFEGTESNPIKIKSSDGTSNSFTVIQAVKKSVVKNVIFEGMNTLNYKGWVLTGSVNFYESDVELINVQFKSNNSEDALNIIRSEFLVDSCYFYDTYGDAFDSDFSHGVLTNTKFEQLGNDAIDFSGSIVDIISCVILNATDKGISGGENSNLTISDCEVDGANIGIASKDLSQLTINSSNVKNCVYGLVLLQKKPEYGPATIIARDYNWENVTTPYLIEKKSSVNLNGTIIIGTESNVYNVLYL
jgi:hypothetical protein